MYKQEDGTIVTENIEVKETGECSLPTFGLCGSNLEHLLLNIMHDSSHGIKLLWPPHPKLSGRLRSTGTIRGDVVMREG